LIDRSGFPEPLKTKVATERDRWRHHYINGLIREDILDFERVHDLKKMTYLVALLRKRVGSPLSYSSLARDLEIHHGTVKKYISILESLFIVFLITPYSRSISRSILKEPKLYFYDTGLVDGDEGVKFENTSALHLFQYVQFAGDYLGKSIELQTIRTKEKKEIDFVLAENGKLSLLIECKLSDPALTKTLISFSEKYDVKGIQLVHHLKEETQFKNCQVRRAESYFKNLELGV